MAELQLHRKVTRVEWSESGQGAAAANRVPPAGTPGGLHHATVNTVVNACFASIEKKALLVGGYDPNAASCVSQVLEYDLNTKQWTSLGHGYFPECISEAAMAACGDAYYLFGGWNGSALSSSLWMAPATTGPEARGNSTLPSVTDASSIDGTSRPPWRLLSPRGSGPCARCGHSMVTGSIPTADGHSESVVFLFGGFNGSQRMNDLWCLRVSGARESGTWSWEEVQAVGMRPTPRDSAAVAFDPASRRLFVFGGFSEALQSDLHILEWQGPDRPPRWWHQPCRPHVSPRQGAIAAVYNGYLVVCCGSNERGAVEEVIQLSLSDWRWSLAPFDREDLKGRFHASSCAVDGGKKILLFGGTATTSTLEVELDRSDPPVPVAKGRK